MTVLPTTVVVPTVGRASLRALLEALRDGGGPRVSQIIVVDDRPQGDDLAGSLADLGLDDLRVVRSGGGGPARARNLGWRLARTRWVSFLDDDVVPDHDWRARLQDDLDAAEATVAGSQGQVRVPLPDDRRPTDWERSTAGLASAQWITADMTYRRSWLASVGGFDERFPRAFREDADLGLRVSEAGGRLVRGRRSITHPVRPTDDWVSVRQQAGNADDVLMRRLHGPRWRERAGAPSGRRPRHLAIMAVAGASLLLAAAGRRRAAAGAGALWAVGTAEFALTRILPGPRDVAEVRRMLVTSAAIPVAASWHTALGHWRHRRVRPWRGLPDLVLFDRDGTLVHDVPYNGDPELVRAVASATTSLERLRGAGVRVGVITNQSGIGRGVITSEQTQAVNTRIDQLLGPFDVFHVCPHTPDAGCECRKPAPGMITQACASLEVEPAKCVVVGDIGSDVEAAEAAGARGILVPNAATRPGETTAAARTATDLARAVDDILAGAW